MIHSFDCCFYRNGRETESYRNIEYPLREAILPKVGNVKRREKRESLVSCLKEKKRQGNITTKWLKQNFCACPDVCLPREIVYEQYLDFCKKENFSPTCKATFGKLIRNAFPEVSSKRLGARGHSKYHYNGIGMKQNNAIRNTVPAFEGVTRFSSSTPISEWHNLKKFSLTSKVGTLIQSFPDVQRLTVSESSDRAKMKTFVLMYKIHCQCIVDVCISGNFEEIRLFLLHFWQGFPEHLISLTRLDVFLDLTAVCDSILYRTLLDVLIPSMSFEVPESLLRNIHNMSMHWSLWIQSSLENMSQKLLEMKMAQARRFCRSLKRCVAFIHISQVTRPILQSDAPIMLCKQLEEIQPIFLNNIGLYSNSTSEDDEMNDITTEQTTELQNILRKCSSLQDLIESLDEMILSLKVWKEQDKDSTRNFVFNWIYMLSKISYRLTEDRSSLFTTFHLLSSLIQEYVLLAAESQLDKEHEQRIHTRFRKHFNSTSTDVADAFKSPTTCFLEIHEKLPSAVISLHKERKNVKQTISQESSTLCPSSNAGYPTAYAHHFSLENETPKSYCREILSPRDMPSCKYASITQCTPIILDDHYKHEVLSSNCPNAPTPLICHYSSTL